MRRIYLLYCLLLVILLSQYTDALCQEKWWKDRKFKNESQQIKYNLCKKTFVTISDGFNSRNISYISQYLNDNVILNLLGYEKSYYSKNQAEIMLADFIEYFYLIKFMYTNSFYMPNYAFVVGTYKYDRGQGSKLLSVNISLRYKNNAWTIDQLSIN